MTDPEYYSEAHIAFKQKNLTAFLEAVTKMHNVNYICDFVIYPNGYIEHGLPLLHYATILSNLNCIKWLLIQGAQINTQNIYGKTALDYALSIDPTKIKIFMHLDAVGAKLSTALQHPFPWCSNNLHTLAYMGNQPDIVDALLQSEQYTANQPNQFGQTALHTAVYFGNLQISKLLLLYGASPNIPNSNGITPLALLPYLDGHPNYQAMCNLLWHWSNKPLQQMIPTNYSGYHSRFHQSSASKPLANVKLQNKNLSDDDSDDNLAKSPSL